MNAGLSAVAAATVAAAIGLAPASAAAQEGSPNGRLGLVLGGRQNVGGLADDYALGTTWGIHAGYQLATGARPWSVGGAWSVLWSRFGAANDDLVGGPLSVLEMNFGLHFRWLLSEGAARFVTLSAGGTLYRANIPIPPDDERIYLGPYAGLGTEVYLSGEYLLSLEARYGLLTGGPGSLLVLAGFAFGN
jgi:hypothetical protein